MDEIISMNWNKVLFLNIELEIDHLKPHIPSELEIRTYNKKSFITLVFFNLEDPGIEGFNIPITLSEFNIRTYVRYKSFEGIFFLTLDINNCLLPMIINRVFKLNYHKNTVKYKTENHVNLINWSNKIFNLNNLTFDFKVGEPLQTNSFSRFITENYLYLSQFNNNVYYNKVYHRKWELDHVNLSNIKNFNIFEKTTINSAFYSNHLKVKTGLPVKIS